MMISTKTSSTLLSGPRGSPRGMSRMGTRRWGIFPVGTGIGGKIPRGSGGKSPTQETENGKFVGSGESAKNGDGDKNSPVAENGAGTGNNFGSENGNGKA
ncbi:hypothetical protein PIB30_005890 [Stylosanthes scabra]|uniref:Uncharacterized protein n=1 Tax=Stylosanthes scabra TaxID=79078 RepID=A0ABU6Q438_9FABA|nr:hypothetical protein [Stylosanthes scabra]